MRIPAARNELPLDWRIPCTTAIVVTATAFPFLWNKDFGWFLAGIFFYVPVLGIICIAALAVAVFAPALRNTILASVSVSIIGLFLLFLINKYEHDRVMFFAWYPLHLREVRSVPAGDRIVRPWDSWGMAGSDNDSYLISNPGNTINEVSSATRWLKAQHSSCEAAAVQHMIGDLYILTTYNCPLITST